MIDVCADHGPSCPASRIVTEGMDSPEYRASLEASREHSRTLSAMERRWESRPVQINGGNPWITYETEVREDPDGVAAELGGDE